MIRLCASRIHAREVTGKLFKDPPPTGPAAAIRYRLRIDLTRFINRDDFHAISRRDTSFHDSQIGADFAECQKKAFRTFQVVQDAITMGNFKLPKRFNGRWIIQVGTDSGYLRKPLAQSVQTSLACIYGSHAAAPLQIKSGVIARS